MQANIAKPLEADRLPFMKASIAREWRGMARWLSLLVAAIYLSEAVPLFLGHLNDVGAVVGLFIGLVVGAATLTGNSKLPLGMAALAAVQAAGLIVNAFVDTVAFGLVVRFAFFGITTAATVALWKAHRLSTV